VFGAEAGAAAWAPAAWLLPAALLTIVIGYVGLLAARGLRELSAFAVIGSTGTLLAAVALFEADAMAAAIYYLPHSTLAGAALFLISGLIGARRPGIGGDLVEGPRFHAIGPISILFLLAALALVGLPPLSGFIGKLLILDAARSHPAAPWIWGTILVTTLIGIVGLARAGSLLFWKSAAFSNARPRAARTLHSDLAPPAALLSLLAALAFFAGPATDFAAAAAAQLFEPQIYVEAVLGGQLGG
jgi:multicomponent K+:H+ antiporter subunit D